MISCRRRLRPVEAERRLRLRRQRDLLQRAREDAAALRDQRLVVVLPARARQIEQALPLGEAPRRIGIGIDEDVAMVEGGDQLDGLLAQHAVAEHVARHVADADDRERRRADVDVHLAEVALDRLPGAARGDAHLLVVVAGRAAGGEGVVEPEMMLVPKSRWRCRRRSRCPCRRRPPDRDRRRRGARTLSGGITPCRAEIVGDVEQRRDEQLVGRGAFGLHGLARCRRAMPSSASARSRPWRRPARSPRS